ncbi:MAG: aldo/keto reductase [Terriglobia bacterium]|jgi:aryl-alcohol dehydrogenase-like predicted oxidoreductase
MKRREFLTRAASGAGALWLGSKALSGAALPDAPPTTFSASDTVTLGKTGIKTSRLACGTGTVGYGGHSHQTSLGVEGLADLLVHGYERGLRFFDAADSYGSHPAVARALKRLPREKITVLTKSDTRDPEGMRRDIDRYRRELQTDYLDVVLMHDMTSPDWTTRYRRTMDVLSEAKEKGLIRSHGCSCHTLGALRAAAASPWVEVDLARINPIGSHMDADPPTVTSVLRQMKKSGKGVVGMKILGQGDMRTRQDEALSFALSLGVLDAMTIGAENMPQQTDLIRRIANVRV